MSNKGIEATLLSKEEVGKSKVLQKVGASCKQDYWTRNCESFYNWSHAFEFIVTSSGALSCKNISNGCGIRPVLKVNNIEELIKGCNSSIQNGIQVVEFGQFPHFFEKVPIVNPSFLCLQSTGKEYVIPQNEYDYKFHFYHLTEYDYKGQKVVKRGEVYHPVKPIQWYVDKENNMLIAKDVLLSSPISINQHNDAWDFNKTQLYRYLNSDFLKQLLNSAEINRVNTDQPDDIKLFKEGIDIKSKKVKITQLETLLTRREKLKKECEELDSQIARLTKKPKQKTKK